MTWLVRLLEALLYAWRRRRAPGIPTLTLEVIMGNVRGTLVWPTEDDQGSPLNLARIERADIRIAAKNDPAWFVDLTSVTPTPGEPQAIFEQAELDDGTWYFSAQVFGTNGRASGVVVASITVGAGEPDTAPADPSLTLEQF